MQLNEDMIRQMWQILPLDQEPTWRNYANYAYRQLKNMYWDMNETIRPCRTLENEIEQLEQQLQPLENQLFSLEYETVEPKYKCIKYTNYMNVMPHNKSDIEWVLQIPDVWNYFKVY